MNSTQIGPFIHISSSLMDIVNKPIQQILNRPHVTRVRKATVMQIQEMANNPKWIKLLENESNIGTQSGGGNEKQKGDHK